ncbi:TerC family protein [Hydrocarboniphaga effusa]|uniref:TerC family protein n=1 Tax=Hydrocarboniphaga effusa TaxID=243629 RepID=UPI003BAD25BA
MDQLTLSPELLLSIAQIVFIDILLGGDNAVVIALACRKLPPELRNKGIFWGLFGAIALRVLLIFFALQLLALPFLKIIGSLLLFWIGIKLLATDDDDDDGHAAIVGRSHLLGAIRTVIVADAVMSIDNVIAIAGAADGHIGLVAFGIVISVPIIVWGSKLVLALMDRFPLVMVLGSALLGWVGGALWLGDAYLAPRLGHPPQWAHLGSAAIGAVLVVAIGKLLAQHRGGS